MINVTNIWNTILKENREEEIQTLIDVIAMNPKAYGKYKNILKTKYGVDFDKEYGNNDESLIQNANLLDIKDKKDFLNFSNYQLYAKEIFSLRGLAQKQPKHINKMVDFDTAVLVGQELGFKVKKRAYTGRGNYAQASTNTVQIPDGVDVNTFIHEVGHVYHHMHYKEGLSSTITYASSPYGIGYTHEVFAENFMHFFIAPNFLKTNLSEVYKDLNRKIKSSWKKELNYIIKH
jgi:hypothetical protein